MNFYFIYKIKLNNTGKEYIGYTNDLNRRIYDHLKALEEGVHINKDIQADFISIEDVSIDIVETFINSKQEIVQSREKYWISFYDTYKSGYNKTSGGEGNLNFRNFNRDSIFEAYAILNFHPEESSAVVQEIFKMSESSVLRLKHKKSYLSTISIFDRMSLEQKENLYRELEAKYSLEDLFAKHKKEVSHKSRGLTEKEVLFIIAIGKNLPKKGAIMERRLNLASSHSSRIVRGLRYKEFQTVYNNLTQEEKESLLEEAKRFFEI